MSQLTNATTTGHESEPLLRANNQMKYVSIDLETTGLDAENCSIIEMAAIVEDTKTQLPREQCPIFHRYIDHGNRMAGEPFALAMNAQLIKTTLDLIKAKDPRVCTADKLMPELDAFLKANGIPGRVLAAGKNFSSFDRNFLDKLPNTNKVSFHHRTLDPVTLYTDFLNDEVPPKTDECMRRAGLVAEGKHQAVDDAWEVILMLRKKYTQQTAR